MPTALAPARTHKPESHAVPVQHTCPDHFDRQPGWTLSDFNLDGFIGLAILADLVGVPHFGS
jgi:hypothetical protein